MTPAEVLALIKDNEVKFVDFRFTDTKGKEQHVTVPAHTVDDDLFEDGKMFDGSSISGWKGINESDMILMPDPDTSVVDIFSDEPTLNLRCTVVEPATMQGYDRCPRSLAERAEAYLKSTGIADTAFFGPENEFFVFDTSPGTTTCRALSTRSIRTRAPGTRIDRSMKTATRAIARRSRAATSRYRRSIRCTTSVRQCALPSRTWA